MTLDANAPAHSAVICTRGFIFSFRNRCKAWFEFFRWVTENGWRHVFFHFAMTSLILPSRPSGFSGVDTSLPVEELREAT